MGDNTNFKLLEVNWTSQAVFLNQVTKVFFMILFTFSSLPFFQTIS